MEFLYERIYKLVTKMSQKVLLDPLKLEVREELTEDDICALQVGVEVDSMKNQESIYAQTSISTLGASITIGHAKTFMERSILAIK